MDLNLDIFKITSNNVLPEKGKILIAEPFLQGYHFSRSIILLTEHDDEGSMGLVLNKPLDVTLDKVIQQYDVKPYHLTCGGPVSPDKLFFIHTFENIPGAMKIIPGLYFGGDFDIIRTLIDNNLPGKIRFFIGYSGWSPGQLTSEIEQNSWLVFEASIDKILLFSNDEFWKSTVKEMGEKYATWANFPVTPEFN